jgi:hypothetical protein
MGEEQQEAAELKVRDVQGMIHWRSRCMGSWFMPARGDGERLLHHHQESRRLGRGLYPSRFVYANQGHMWAVGTQEQPTKKKGGSHTHALRLPMKKSLRLQMPALKTGAG